MLDSTQTDACVHIAGGLWQPEPNHLALLRRDIDRRPQRMKQALCDTNIRKEYLDGVANDDRKVVKKFVAHNAESALKTKPKVGDRFFLLQSSKYAAAQRPDAESGGLLWRGG